MNERLYQAVRAGMPRLRSSRTVAAVLSAAVWIAILGSASPAGAVPVPLTNCGGAGDPVSIQMFDASVWPPQAGKLFFLTIKWTLGEDIARGGHEAILITVPSAPTDFRFPLVLPLLAQTAGPHTSTSSFTVPRWLSGQLFGLHLAEYDRSGNRLVCLDVTIPIK